jgi:glycosyltransferase involved in cell wall biosynthesis
MKICLVGDFSVPDEARKVMAHHLFRTMSKEHSVEVFDLTRWSSADAWRNLKLFAPDIVHYIPGASPFSFFFTRVLKVYLGTRTKTVTFSALDPCPGLSFGLYYTLSCLGMRAIPLIKTDLVLVQSDRAERLYKELRCEVKYFAYSGVDVDKFHPISVGDKRKLRFEYGIDPETFVVLHVGTVRKWRNVENLIDIQNQVDTQVVLVGRSTTKNEKDVEQALRKAGMIIIDGYNARIEECYGLADCYVFPTTTSVGSIDVPLTVLEAMAHNLPVVSTKFGGLPKIFKEESGFFYSDAASFCAKIQALRQGLVDVNTRELVLPYSWDNIANNLYDVYQELLDA